MKSLFVMTAAALTTVALSLPASASTVGCKPGNPTNESVKASDCQVWDQMGLIAPGYGAYGYAGYGYGGYDYGSGGYGYAYAPRARARAALAYGPYGYSYPNYGYYGYPNFGYAYAPRVNEAMAYTPAPRTRVSKTKKSRAQTVRSPQSQPLPSLRDNQGLSGGSD